ncbi:MAG: carboxypeptidase-like regulatory domain-containing protein [Deltaproteobacteria bacterium]|nr:carboxypeptidase-like regulatory domain-containing protein [Deltaproteobacteria bacterium]
MIGISKPVLSIFLIFAWVVVITPNALSKDVTYRGKVIDADTKEPIEGAAVVVYWDKAWQTISGESTELKEVKEILTDKNGEWSIVGPKGKENDPHPYLSFFLLLSYTREPRFIIFKPGYCSWPGGFSIAACREKIKPGGTGEIMEGKTIELSKLTTREDRLRAMKPGLVIGEGALEKQREFIRLLNEERRNLRLPEYKY